MISSNVCSLDDVSAGLEVWVQHEVLRHGAAAAEHQHVAVLEATHCQEVVIHRVGVDTEHHEWHGSRRQACDGQFTLAGGRSSSTGGSGGLVTRVLHSANL